MLRIIGMPRVHLVDATYELFRACFAQPSRRAPDGREVGAVRGLLLTLNALCRKEGATHVGGATDHVVRSFRNDLYAGYKTEEGVGSSRSPRRRCARLASWCGRWWSSRRTTRWRRRRCASRALSRF